MLLKRFTIALLLIAMFSTLVGQEVNAELQPGLSKTTKGKVKSAADMGVRFLRNSQNKDGNWDHPGITALALYALFLCPRKYGPEDGPWVRRPMDHLLSLQKDNGGIYQNQLANYITSVTLMALSGNEKVAKEHKEAIEKAQKFLVGLQCDEDEGYDPQKDPLYGGIGYGGDERPDLSNTQYALEALYDSGLSQDNPVYQKALIFLQRCQNRSESNDQKEWVGDDGGFIYYPAKSEVGTVMEGDKKRPRSYGSMTYAGIKSYIYAKLDKNDERVQAAYDWIRRNYSLEENPNAGQSGLYYYYYTFAKTMTVLGDDFLVDSDGKKRNWREDLANALLAKQREDGSWVNEQDRWWEGDPRLVTAYAVLALSLCYE